jgi:hypothetical protein
MAICSLLNAKTRQDNQSICDLDDIIRLTIGLQLMQEIRRNVIIGKRLTSPEYLFPWCHCLALFHERVSSMCRVEEVVKMSGGQFRKSIYHVSTLRLKLSYIKRTRSLHRFAFPPPCHCQKKVPILIFLAQKDQGATKRQEKYGIPNRGVEPRSPATDSNARQKTNRKN